MRRIEYNTGSTLHDVVGQVCDELRRAQSDFPAFNSAHEGYAIIEEEVDELWDAVKRNEPENAHGEAVQVAAMALRFLLDLPVDAEGRWR